MDFLTKLKLYCAFLVFVYGAAAQDSACYQTKMACLPDMDADVSTFCSESNINTVRSCIDNADCAGDLLSDNIVEGHFRRMVEMCQEPICLQSMRACFPVNQAKFSRMNDLTDDEIGAFCFELVSATGCLTDVQSKCQSVSLGALQGVAMELTKPTIFIQAYCSMQIDDCALTALQCLPDSFLTMEASDKTIEGSCQEAPSVITCIDNTTCAGPAQESFRALVRDKYGEHCSILPITGARKCFASIATDVADPRSAACSLANVATCVGDAKLYSTTLEQEVQVQVVEDALVTECVPKCDKDALKACVATFCGIHKGICIKNYGKKDWLAGLDEVLQSLDSNEDVSSPAKRKRRRRRFWADASKNILLKRSNRLCGKVKDALLCMRDSLVGCVPDEVKDILPTIRPGLKKTYFHYCTSKLCPSQRPIDILMRGLHRNYSLD